MPHSSAEAGGGLCGAAAQGSPRELGALQLLHLRREKETSPGAAVPPWAGGQAGRGHTKVVETFRSSPKLGQAQS